MAVNVNAAAHYICNAGNWTVTNLALQKILYLAHMVHIGRYGVPLVNGRFEAWDYGPVHPELYQKVKAFGAKPIPNVFFALDQVGDGLEKSTLQEASNNLLNKSAAELVSNTHWEQGAWAMHYNPSQRNILIPEQDIAREYGTRTGQPH
jgi:uncharacterized phage-associated protein